MASYEQSKSSKLWSVRFREIDLDSGEEKNKRLSGYKTKREAQAAYHDHVTAYEEEKALRLTNEGKSPKDEVTFGHLAKLYFNSLKGNTRESTIITYQSKYRKGIEPYFANKPFSKIAQIDILNWQSWLTDKGYSFAYKQDIRTVLNFIFKFGEDTFDYKNVAKKVKGFRDAELKDEKIKFWTPEQIQIFLNHVDDAEYRLFFKTLYATGCRIGEIFALSWGDVDEVQSVIHINKSVTRKIKPWQVTPPKNKTSIRDIPISQSLTVELKAQAQKNGLSARFLFGGDQPLSDKTAENKMVAAWKKANLPKLTMHGLRHSCATTLISRNINIVAVSKRLGHKDVRETLNTYGHLMPSDAEKMTEILAEIE